MKTMIFSLVIVLMLVVMACSHAANLPPAVQQAAGTWPRCISGCTANDVEINSVWLDVPAGNYTLGETVTHNVSMNLYFHRQNTYCIAVVADLYEGGVLQQTDWVSNIIGYHDGSGNYTYSMGTVNWTYGTLFEMRNVLVEWSQNKPAGTCPTDCSNYVSSKCTQVATLIVTTPLIVDFEFNEVCFCNNTTFIDKTTGGEGSYTYDWDFGDSLGTSTEQNPIYHYASNGTYTVTLNVTDSDSPPNIDSQSYNVTVNEKPTATASSNSPVCEGATIELYGGPDGMTSYSWTGPNGFNSSSQSPTIPNATTSNAGTYSLTVTDGGCTSDPANTVVVVGTKPTAIASSNSPVCEGATIVLYGGPDSMASYSWTGPNGFNSSSQSPTIPNTTTSNAGTYYLTVTDGGCTSDPANTTVVVGTKPTASASSNSPVSEGATIQLYGGPDGMTSYSWTGPGGWTSSLQNPTRTGATTTMAGTYTLTVTNSNGCTDDESTSVIVNTKPTTKASSNPPVCCRSLMISSTEGGSITTAGEGESSYVDGTVVDLVASPNPGYKFVNWTGNVGTIANVNTASTTITMVGCYSITANFALIPTYAYELTMAADPEAGGTATDLTNESPYAEAAEVNIIAEANEGYRFVNWTAPAGVFGNATAVETIFTMPAQNVTVTANFEEVSLPSGVPTVTTQAATGISSYAGFVNMSYTVGNFSPVQVRFACKRSTDPAWFYTTWVSRTADGTYTEVLTGLISQTEYEFKAQLKYNGTVIDGNTLQFTTTTQPSGGCFIATAAYGTPTAEQLDVLREFRDIVLLESTAGSQFVALYYQLSPPVADFISGNEFLRTLVRELLADPIVWIVEATGDIWRN